MNRCHQRPPASKRLLLIALLLGAAISPSAAWAWGPQGHALVADIASANLQPAVRARVRHLLALEHDSSLDQIADWADAIRHRRPATASWHYVDIPLPASGYKARRDCPKGNCVVTRITSFSRILGDPGTTEKKRLEALKFVVHFVADAQQPLHAEDHDDYGGNDVKLRYFGHRTNLHAIWDGDIIERALHLYVGPHYSIDRDAVRAAADRLNAAITPVERHRWSSGIRPHDVRSAAIRWVNQAHRLARSVAYGDLPDSRPRGWSARYQQQAWPVVKRQLQCGGLRLAALLNAVLGS